MTPAADSEVDSARAISGRCRCVRTPLMRLVQTSPLQHCLHDGPPRYPPLAPLANRYAETPFGLNVSVDSGGLPQGGVQDCLREFCHVLPEDVANYKILVASKPAIATEQERFKLRTCSEVGIRSSRSGLAEVMLSGKPLVSQPKTNASPGW